ncbi:MAG: hypothetical protein K6E83_05150 [Clostridium sp.]|nr:hypothetical protein [Clostridium sp.]
MTLNHSFSADVPGGQRELLKRRLWPFALSLLLFVLFHVAGSFLILTANRTSMESTGMYTAEEILFNMQEELSLLTGLRSLSPFITCILAVVLAVQGYAWLDSRQELDFYESQPFSRRSHFFSIFFNNVLIYVFSYLVTMLLAHLVALGLGVHTPMSGAVFAESLLEAVRSLILFLGIHAVTLLAVMLTGNIIISLLAASVLFLYEFFFRLMLEGFREEFYLTYVSRDAMEFMPVLSPLRWYLEGTGAAASFMDHAGYLEKPFVQEGTAGEFISLCLPFDMRNLLLAAGITALAYYCYHIRKSECAGSAVIFRPVRGIVRVAIAVLCALFTGSILYNINSTVKSYGTAAAFIGIVITAVIMACVMQIIYEYNFKALFRHPWEIALAVLLGLLIFGIFRFDMTGYDRRLPAASSVESCAVFPDDWFSQYADENGDNINQDNYVREHMILTDTEAVFKAAEAGIARLPESGKDYSADSWVRILFRMKNGKNVFRNFPVPADRPELMDAVVGGSEYREGIYPLYRDDYVRSHRKNLSFRYETGWTALETDEDLYDGFCEAYAADLERYSYSLAHREFSVGVFHVILNYRSGWQRIDECYEIYPSYASTIAFLQEHGMWADAVPPAEAFLEAVLYDSGEYGNENGNFYDGETVYPDPEQIREILKASVPEEARNLWHTADQLDERYRVSLRISRDFRDEFNASHENAVTTADDISFLNLRFLADRVPAFLERQ